MAQPDRAAEHLARAVNIFRELGARLDLARAEQAATALDHTGPDQSRQNETVAQLLTLRLAEAVASSELLLHELAAVIRQETNCRRVMIFEPDEVVQRVVVAHGYCRTRASALAAECATLKADAQIEPFAKKRDVAVINLKSSNAPPATLLFRRAIALSFPAGSHSIHCCELSSWEWTFALCASGAAAIKVRRKKPHRPARA